MYSAENPASRPKIRNTPIRSCEPSVVRCRLISSLRARVIAVEKPMQYSVPGTSLSIVFGIATSGTPASTRTRREAQRVVAADRDEVVEPEPLDVVEDERRQVVDVRRPVAIAGEPVAVDARRAAVEPRIFRGFVREVWSNVPPVRSIVRVFVRSSGRT